MPRKRNSWESKQKASKVRAEEILLYRFELRRGRFELDPIIKIQVVDAAIDEVQIVEDPHDPGPLHVVIEELLADFPLEPLPVIAEN